MRTAIYTRISTDKQTHDSQLLELRQFCAKRGWSEVIEFSDRITGSKFSRQGLDGLLSEVRRGRVARIVVFKLDRLGRSLAHLAQIVAELSNLGTALVCTSQSIDTTDANPAGRLQLAVLMAVAEFEKAIIIERVNAGLAAARAKGVVLGRPATLHLHRDKVTELMAEGKGARLISKALGVPLSSVCKLIKQIRSATPALGPVTKVINPVPMVAVQ